MNASVVLLREAITHMGHEEKELLAEILRPYIAPSVDVSDDGWMDTKAAAKYLGMTAAALRTRVGRVYNDPHPIPVHQERDGGRLAFKRSELDAWQRGE